MESHTRNTVQSSQRSKRVGKFLVLNDISVKTRGALGNALETGASSTWTQLNAEAGLVPGAASPLSGA